MKRVGDGERLWYRRTCTRPAAHPEGRLLLHFGAVDWQTTVWVNGKEVGTHRGGYDPFTFDITDALKPAREQELVVAVWDPTDAGTQPRGKQVRRPGGIWYTPTTGIWQTVWLEPVPATYIPSLSIVPDLGGNRVLVTVSVANAGAGDEVELQVPGVGSPDFVLGTPGRPIVRTIPNPTLWTPDSPHLYDLRVQLMRGGRVIDEVTSYFSMRSIALAKDSAGVTRLMLNGRPLFQYGLLDQGFWPDGLYTAPTDEALKSDIEATKKL